MNTNVNMDEKENFARFFVTLLNIGNTQIENDTER